MSQPVSSCHCWHFNWIVPIKFGSTVDAVNSADAPDAADDADDANAADTANAADAADVGALEPSCFSPIPFRA